MIASNEQAKIGTPAAAPRTREAVGRVTALSGAQATVTLQSAQAIAHRDPLSNDYATVGRFLGLVTDTALIIGVVSEINETSVQAVDATRSRQGIARLDRFSSLPMRSSSSTSRSSMR